MDNYPDLLANIAFGLNLAAAFIGAVRFRRLSPALRGLALLSGFDALLNALGILLLELQQSNLLLYPIALVGEVALLVYSYGCSLRSVAFIRAAPWLVTLYAGLVLSDIVGHGGLQHQFTTSQIGSYLLTLALTGLYFRQLLNELAVRQLHREPFFWLSVALVIYALGNLLIALFSDFLMAHYSRPLQRLVLLGVRNLFNIELYVAYCMALLLRPAPRPAA